MLLYLFYFLSQTHEVNLVRMRLASLEATALAFVYAGSFEKLSIGAAFFNAVQNLPSLLLLMLMNIRMWP